MKGIFCALLLPIVAFASEQPERETGWEEKAPVYGKEMMVVSANPHASQAGFAVLKAGGNALDAAVAMQLVLGVVEPQSSGLGGGAFLLFYEKATGEVIAFNGRETAPAQAHARHFLDRFGIPLPRNTLIRSGISVGVPGCVKMLEEAHRQLGRSSWNTLFGEAIRLAEEGFEVSPRLEKMLASATMVDTLVVEEGYVKNQPLAKTLRSLAQEGSRPFYEGAIGDAIVARVRDAGGVMTQEDLARYRPLQPSPLVTHWHGHQIVGLPVRSCCGGDVVSTILGELEPLEGSHPGDVAFIEQFSAASHQAYVKWYPYLSSLASTSHLCVVDREGNAVSMTTSIENAFGSTLMAGGFFLNNTLTDFSYLGEVNLITPDERPFSAMSPTFVFKEGSLRLALGSAGGLRIVDYVTQALCNVLGFGLNIQEAIAFPHIASLRRTIDLEKGTFLESLVPQLQARGWDTHVQSMTSGTQGIQVTDEGLIGGVDPRREGLALGR